MKLTGWLRLWIFVSGLYFVIVSVFAVFTLPQASTIPHSETIYDQIQPEQRKKILGAKRSDGTSSERQALLDEARQRGIISEVEMPNGHVLVFASELSRKEQENAAKAYWTVVEKTAKEERRKYIGIAFLWWAVPTLAVYVLGWGIGWVYRGFRHP
jgi:hypothetical protein